MQAQYTLSDDEFNKLRELVYREVGISLGEHKRALVQSRLRKWLIEFGLQRYDELYEKIVSDKSGQMLTLLVNAITTNVTSFFREESQWFYLQEHIDELFDTANKRIRIWSAACSSGQEPYSIIMFLKEHLSDFSKWDIKILATDISEEILRKAMDGVYSQKELENMPRHMLLTNFDKIKQRDGSVQYRVKPILKEYVTFRQFNLVTGNFSIFKNTFDLIFCRNVMIYFDRPTQNRLLKNFSVLMKPESKLFIGHSESVQLKDGTYRLVVPSIYKLA